MSLSENILIYYALIYKTSVQHELVSLRRFPCKFQTNVSVEHIEFNVTIVFELLKYGLVDAPVSLSKIPLAVPSYDSRHRSFHI